MGTSNGQDPEVPLDGGTANLGLVVRVADTVRRPRRPTSPATAGLLAHLERVGFDGAPRHLGYDERGREVLSYIPGDAATAPYADWALTDDALVSVAALLRRFHTAVVTFDGNAYTWPPGAPRRFRQSVISHNDPNLDNVVFRDGQAVALIDFDLASHGSPVWDVATAARLWAPLRDDRDITDVRRGRALERFRIFVDAYGVPEAQRDDVAAAVPYSHDWCYDVVSRGAAAGRPGFRQYWTAAMQARAVRTQEWYADNASRLRAALA